MVNTQLLLKNGESVTVSVPSNTNVDNFTNKSYFQTKGTGPLKQLHYWQLFDDTIIIYGWEQGEAGDENKHELPPPIDNSLYFGDLLVFRLDDNGKLNHLSKEAYEIFIEHQMGGFIDLSEDDDIDDDEDDEDDDEFQKQKSDEDYSPSDIDEEEDDDSSSFSELELDSDNNSDELEEELVDRDILIWGKRKEAVTDNDETTSDDNTD